MRKKYLWKSLQTLKNQFACKRALRIQPIGNIREPEDKVVRESLIYNSWFQKNLQ